MDRFRLCRFRLSGRDRLGLSCHVCGGNPGCASFIRANASASRKPGGWSSATFVQRDSNGLTEVLQETEGEPDVRLFYNDTGQLVHTTDPAFGRSMTAMADLAHQPLTQGRREAMTLPLADFPDWTTPWPDPAGARRHDQGLAQRLTVPDRPSAGLEHHAGARCRRCSAGNADDRVVGWTMVTSGTFSTRTSPAPYMMVARIDLSPNLPLSSRDLVRDKRRRVLSTWPEMAQRCVSSLCKQEVATSASPTDDHACEAPWRVRRRESLI